MKRSIWRRAKKQHCVYLNFLQICRIIRNRKLIFTWDQPFVANCSFFSQDFFCLTKMSTVKFLNAMTKQKNRVNFFASHWTEQNHHFFSARILSPEFFQYFHATIKMTSQIEISGFQPFFGVATHFWGYVF